MKTTKVRQPRLLMDWNLSRQTGISLKTHFSERWQGWTKRMLLVILCLDFYPVWLVTWLKPILVLSSPAGGDQREYFPCSQSQALKMWNKMNGAAHFMIFLLMTSTTKDRDKETKTRRLWIITDGYSEPNTMVTTQRTKFYILFLLPSYI